MGGIAREERLHGVFTHLFVAVGDERPAAPPSAGEVDDLELRRVEERLKVLAPADGARGAVGRGRVAGDEQRGGRGGRGGWWSAGVVEFEAKVVVDHAVIDGARGD